MCDQQSFRPACAYVQSDQSLCYSLEYSMSVKLLTEHHLEFLSLKGATQPRLSLYLLIATLMEITCHVSIMFWLRNGKNNFQSHTFIWRPVIQELKASHSHAMALVIVFFIACWVIFHALLSCADILSK